MKVTRRGLVAAWLVTTAALGAKLLPNVPDPLPEPVSDGFDSSPELARAGCGLVSHTWIWTWAPPRPASGPHMMTYEAPFVARVPSTLDVDEIISGQERPNQYQWACDALGMPGAFILGTGGRDA